MKKLISLSALVLLLLLTGCDLAGINLPITTQPPTISSFGASPASISPGGTSTLNWSVAGASTVSIDQGIGNVALAGSRLVTPVATTVYTLTAANASGVSTTATAQVVVTGTMPTPTPTPAGYPVINYFTASPTTIYAGNLVTLSWNVSNATSISIDNGVGTVPSSGSISVYPATSTNYTITAYNSAGASSKSAYVFVNAGQSSFSVIGVTASVDQPSFSGACPVHFYSQAVITVNGPGTVLYRWENSDGESNPTQSLNFSSAGAQTVNTGWEIDSSGSYWVRVHILSPNETTSNQASLIVNCASVQATGWAGTWDTNWGTMVLTQVGNQVSGTYTWDSGQINGTVAGNVFTGTWSEAPSYSPPDDAGEVQLTISADGQSISGQWRYDSSGSWSSWAGTRMP